ncbi:MAG TPA: hypothetical protein VKU01_23360 [Bryobacteraceae bacterium]|nr:hypothetical protein [Bryobacteraceae bacterium]
MTPADLERWQQTEFIAAFRDHPRFCRESLRIRDLGGSRVPLILGDGQLKLNAAIEKQRDAGLPVRGVVLKTRRSWFTTGVCAQIFHAVPFHAGKRATVIADKYNPAALEAFDYMLQFQRNYLPFRLHGAAIKLPRLVKDTEQELRWANESSLDVLSAEAGDVGRGGGRHWLLCDEVAFWRAPEQTLTGVLNMVPKLPETGVIVQSTANGVGGEFYEMCQRAMDPANELGFFFLFFGWLEHGPYRRSFESPDVKARFADSLDREERALHERHGATLEQLKWRRMTIADECRGKIDLFHQEYPTTPDEAFLASGRAALTLTTLVHMPPWKDPLVGELQVIEEFPQKKLRFVPRDYGALVMGRRPDPAKAYVIGADPSKGKDVSESRRGNDPDWSVGFVVDLETGEQVAQLRERLRPAPFAEYLAILGELYNYAFLVPESNDAGFIDALLRTRYPLERIYNRRRDPTDRRSSQPEEIGFETTSTTRPWLIAALDDAMRDLAIIIRSPIAQQEIRTFVIKPDGKMEHQVGCHDDCVLAAALAVIGLRHAPRSLRHKVLSGVRVYKLGVALASRRNDDD